ncbi:response regulator [Streptomyces sp. NPDC017248]|uniref:response regulator n=1 Tax=unclassified Streptomyces TaxID=2593676 RepID=UPI00379F7039
MTIRVLVCDELPVIGHGLSTLLDAVADIDVIGTTGSGTEALALVRTERPDVVVTDLSLRALSGLELIRRLRTEDAPPRTVVFTRITDADETVGDVLHAGASCLLGKDASPQELVTAIRAAAAGRTVLAPDVAERLVTWFRAQDAPEPAPHPEVTELTPRERTVTRMVARGMSTEEVARELTIGVATVLTHLYRVRTKLGVRDRAQLVSRAYEVGLV